MITKEQATAAKPGDVLTHVTGLKVEVHGKQQVYEGGNFRLPTRFVGHPDSHTEVNQKNAGDWS